jgi:hypothetical protein
LNHWEGTAQEHATRGVQGLQLQIGAQGVALVGLNELEDPIFSQVTLSETLSGFGVNLGIGVEIVHSLNICTIIY